MSLLLEALKKAELAKQSQQQAPGESETTLPLGSGVDLPTGDADPNAPLDITTGVRPDIMTRDRLPSLDQPLELVADETTTPSQLPEPTPIGTPMRAELDLRLDETLPPPRPAPAASGTTIPPLATVGGLGAAAAAAATARAAAQTRSEARLDARTDQREITQPNKPWLSPPPEERQAARQVFEAKQLDYNPRRPFFFTLGALGVFALGAIGYFVYQIQTPSATFTQARPGATTATAPAAPTASTTTPAPRAIAPAPPSTSEPPPAAATPPATPAVTAAAPAPSTPAPGAATPSAPAPTVAAAKSAPPLIAVPDLKAPPAKAPAAAATTPASPAPAAAPIAAAPAPAPVAVAPQPRALESAPRATPAPRAPAPASAVAALGAPAAAPNVQVQRAAPLVDPGVERGYAAFQSGDLEAARQSYAGVLRTDPLNRDALLGLAAIDVRTQNYAGAELRYQRVLEADPRDPHALAGLAGLRGSADPLQTESRLKNLLDQQPEAPSLQFALGNQLAAQARWTEAQSAYFKAFAAEPDNPDFAFNLAVSLEQMRQPRLARDYYQRAMELARGRQASFDRDQAAARVKDLATAQ